LPDDGIHHLCSFQFAAPRHEPPVYLGSCETCGEQVVKIPVFEEDMRELLRLAPASPMALRALAVLEIEKPWNVSVEEVSALHRSVAQAPIVEVFWQTEIGKKLLGAFELVHDWAR
jgi:hypothetical protein